MGRNWLPALIFASAYLGFSTIFIFALVPVTAIVITLIIAQFVTQIALAYFFFRSESKAAQLGFLLSSLLSVIFVVLASAFVYGAQPTLIGSNGSFPNLDGLYFSVVTLTTLGYGDLQPTKLMRLFASLEALYGFLMTPILIAMAVELFRKR